ncbi:Cytochrome C oxidase subunit IV [Burkholderia sp. OK233]|nr:Cytochrome C oxidase subunit IV [Burkholderia sp. OK233]
MLHLLREPLHRTWLVLTVATSVAFWLRADGMVGFAAGAGTLAIAYLKGRLIVLDCMELRHAPPVWRGIFEGWLLLISVALLGVYWIGANDLRGL